MFGLLRVRSQDSGFEDGRSPAGVGVEGHVGEQSRAVALRESRVCMGVSCEACHAPRCHKVWVEI